MTGLAMLPASIVAGLLSDRVSQAAPSSFGALRAVAGIVRLAFVHPPRR